MKRPFKEVWQLIRQRQGTETLAVHLERRYGIGPVTLSELDAGVYRVDRRDGRSWVARLFPAARPVDRAEGDARVLRFLEGHAFPAERLADDDPVSVHEGQAVLVTEFVDGALVSRADERLFQVLGSWLGRLHALPPVEDGVRRPGGAIHAFTLEEGTLADEVGEAMSWLAAAGIPDEHKQSYDELVANVAHVDYGETLPQALVHPDPTLRNFIVTADGDPVAIDWTGAGHAPRAHSLAFLLLSAVSQSRWKADSSRVDAVIDGYRRYVKLEDHECTAIAATMPLHVLVRDCGAFCMGRMTFDEVAGGYSAISRLARVVSEKVRKS